MQAIKTYFLPPTNYKGPRIVAVCEAKRVTYNWDADLGVEENHIKAAKKLMVELGWWKTSDIVTGSLKNDGYAHCLIKRKDLTND